MSSWSEVRRESYPISLVLVFLSRLTYVPLTRCYETVVSERHIAFTTESIADALDLSVEGIDPYAPFSLNEFCRDTAVRALMGHLYVSDRGDRRLYRREVPPRIQLLSYLLHFNVMPRGGQSIDEISNPQIRVLYGLLTGQAVNFRKILNRVFNKMAGNRVSFVGYHRLITLIMRRNGVSFEGTDMTSGESVDRDKLVQLNLPIDLHVIATERVYNPPEVDKLPSVDITRCKGTSVSELQGHITGVEERIQSRLKEMEGQLERHLDIREQLYKAQLVDMQSYMRDHFSACVLELEERLHSDFLDERSASEFFGRHHHAEVLAKMNRSFADFEFSLNRISGIVEQGDDETLSAVGHTIGPRAAARPRRKRPRTDEG